MKKKKLDHRTLDSNDRFLGVVAAIAGLIVSVAMMPSSAASRQSVTLELVSPAAGSVRHQSGFGSVFESRDTAQNSGDIILNQARSGWPLTFRLVARRPIGIAIPSIIIEGQFPEQYKTGWLVFSDPDGCLTLRGSFQPPFLPGFPPCPQVPPMDETFVQFTPDIDIAGSVDTAGDIDLQAALMNHRPDQGPLLSDVNDGVGYGADDDLPGFVLLSDAGVGRLYNEDFDRLVPAEARNLAGFLTSVAYELVDGRGRTSLLASINVPRFLFTPIVQHDNCFGEVFDIAVPDCETTAHRVDGGPVVSPAADDWDGLLSNHIVEVRAFVVNAVAPDTIADMDGDTVIGARDAELAGYTLLSNEIVLRIRQGLFGTVVCTGAPGDFGGGLPGGSTTYLQRTFMLGSDLDDNGQAPVAIVCSTGPGDLTGIPR